MSSVMSCPGSILAFLSMIPDLLFQLNKYCTCLYCQLSTCSVCAVLLSRMYITLSIMNTLDGTAPFADTSSTKSGFPTQIAQAPTAFISFIAESVWTTLGKWKTWTCAHSLVIWILVGIIDLQSSADLYGSKVGLCFFLPSIKLDTFMH